MSEENEIVQPRKGMIFYLEEKDWHGVWEHHVDWNEEKWASAKDADSGSDWVWTKERWEDALRSGAVIIVEKGEDPPKDDEKDEEDAVESDEED